MKIEKPLKEYKIYECIEMPTIIMYALAYDDNIIAPTITLKDSLIRCIRALKTRGMLNIRHKIGLFFLELGQK